MHAPHRNIMEDEYLEPLYPYMEDGGHVNVDTISREAMTQILTEQGNHRIKDDYVYGVKFVSDDGYDMFGANQWRLGSKHRYQEADKKNNASRLFSHMVANPATGHLATVGIWSFSCFPRNIKMNENSSTSTLRVPILIRYPIGDVLPVGNHLKGRVAECVSTEWEDVKEYIFLKKKTNSEL